MMTNKGAVKPNIFKRMFRKIFKKKKQEQVQMPLWAHSINPNGLIPISGHFFKIAGIMQDGLALQYYAPGRKEEGRVLKLAQKQKHAQMVAEKKKEQSVDKDAKKV